MPPRLRPPTSGISRRRTQHWPPSPVPIAALGPAPGPGGTNHAAWAAVYDCYDPWIRGSLDGRRIGGRRLQRADVDDLAQEIWRRVIAGVRGPRPPAQAAFPAWLRRVARHVFLDFAAARSAAARRADRHAQDGTDATGSPAGAAQGDAAEVYARIARYQRLIDGLAPRDRAIMYRYLSGATHAAIAAEFSFASENVVANKLHRIKAKLRALYEQLPPEDTP